MPPWPGRRTSAPARWTAPTPAPGSSRWRTAGRWAIRGDRDHPFTRGALCGKVNHYLDAVNGPDRLTYPDGAGRSQGSGPGVVRAGDLGRGGRAGGGWPAGDASTGTAPRRSCRSTSPARWATSRAGRWGPGCSPTWARRGCAPRSARRPRRQAMRSIYGGSVGFEPEIDRRDARLILLWGANLLSTNLHQWPFVQEAQARGAYVVAIDPLRTDTAARCDEHIAPLAGDGRGAGHGPHAAGARRRRRRPSLARGAHRRLAGPRGSPGRVAGRAGGGRVPARRRRHAAARRPDRGHPPDGGPGRARPPAPLRRRADDPGDPGSAARHRRLPLPGRRRPVYDAAATTGSTRSRWCGRPACPRRQRVRST